MDITSITIAGIVGLCAGLGVGYVIVSLCSLIEKDRQDEQKS